MRGRNAWSCELVFDPAPLFFNPGALARRKSRGLALGPPSRDRHAHGSVIGNSNHIAPRAGVANERQERFGVRGSTFGVLGSGFERERQLHQWPPYTTKPRLRRLSASATSMAAAFL